MKKKHNYLERVEYLKNNYYKYLTSKNDKGLKIIKGELIKIIHKWENKINRLDDENEKMFQEQLKNEALLFLNEVKNAIKQMEENMENNIDATEEINKVKETCEQYVIGVKNLLYACDNYFNAGRLKDTERLIQQLSTNFNKWKNIIDAFPSIDLSEGYDELHNKFIEIKNKFETTNVNNTEENMDNENDVNDTNNTETEKEDNDNSSEEENDSPSDDDKSTNNDAGKHTETVDAEVVDEKDDSINWSCATGSALLGVVLGVVAAFFFTGDD